MIGRDQEDAVISVLAAAYADLAVLAPVQLVLSLAEPARIWGIAEDLADHFPGLNRPRFSDWRVLPGRT